MARITINELYEVVTEEPHKATDYEIYKDRIDGDYRDLLFQSLKDTKNLYSISATLKNPDGTLYDPSEGSCGRVRLWYGDTPTEWFDLIPCRDGEGFVYNLPAKIGED